MVETKAGQPDRKRVIQDVWTRTLSQIPTTFGRIAYLASLRDPNTGRYGHFGLAQMYSLEEASEALYSSHRQVFAEWLNFPLARQKEDLEEYLLSLEGERSTVLRAWASLHSYQNLLPAPAGSAEKELFVSDLELILELLQTEPSSPSSPTPGA
jgi:hypothetical protein